MSDTERKCCDTCRYCDYFERYQEGRVADEWLCRFMPVPVQVSPAHWCGQWRGKDSGGVDATAERLFRGVGHLKEQYPGPPEHDRGITAS